MSRVLLIEDDRDLLKSLTQSLELADIEVLAAASFVEAKDHILRDFDGVILSDIRMPGRDGFDVLDYARAQDSELPVVLLTAEGDVPMAVRAMTQGAWDFLEKPCAPDHLTEVLHRALDHRRLVLRSREMEQRMARSDAAALNFPGKSPASSQLRDALRALAGQRGHIHLFGPLGAGRRLAANTIFTLSPGVEHFLNLPLDQVSPGDIDGLVVPEGPVDVSLKGLEAMTPAQEAALVSLLAARPEIRVISSALKPLAQLDGLRELRDTLGLSEIELPSLAKRKADLPVIFETLVRQTVRTLNGDMPPIPEDLVQTIVARKWPGNLPELRRWARSFAIKGVSELADTQALPLSDQLDAYERTVLQDTLERHKGRATATAHALGLPRKTLYDRLARYGLKPGDFKR